MGTAPQIKLWEKEISDITTSFLSEFGKFNEEDMNSKPGPETWSISQNIDHIIKTNESYFPIIHALIRKEYKAPFHSRLPLLPEFFGILVYKAVEPERKRKGKTFPVWEPVKHQTIENIIGRFEEHQQRLVKTIAGCEELIMKKTVIHSPASRLVVYKLEKAIDIIIAHEKRHFNQAMEVAEILKIQ